uniref:NIF3-like protein 1 n=1 Tax=Nannospalax galili TaxID=1026970 RepID=A0A8C6W4F3_NANGA
MQVVAFLSQNSQLYQKTEILLLEKPLLLHTGMGRLCTLDQSVSLATMIEHIKLSHLLLALGIGKTLRSPVKVVALCAGFGSSVLQEVEADLYLTGEMSHHDVLDAASKGINVLLCEHSLLSYLQEMLGAHLDNKINIILSETDRDPLCVV